jgi:hypothetical protein
MSGVLEERRPPWSPLPISLGTQTVFGSSASGGNLDTEVGGRARGEATQEGEGTKFESALPTLLGKVFLGAPWAETG